MLCQSILTRSSHLQVSVFADGLYGKTNMDVHGTCLASDSSHAEEWANEFPVDNETGFIIQLSFLVVNFY